MTRVGDVMSESEILGARALREWITGRSDAFCHVFMVEGSDELQGVERVAGPDDAILLPSDAGPYRGAGRVVRYGGALGEAGDELFLGERGVELQDYVAAGFVQVVGPTAVGVFDATGWRAFLDDAELARRTGVFPSALIDPRVLLANRDAVAKPLERAAPRAIRVRRGGGISVGLAGDVIGDIGQLRELLATPIPRAFAWAHRRSTDEAVTELARRGWMGRYLHASDLIKMLRLAPGTTAISGFGWSFLDDDEADAEPRTSAPFLLETAEGLVLADVTTRRRQLLSRSAASVVAVMQTSSTLERAADRTARRLGIPSHEAQILCRQAITALDVRVGGPADESPPKKATLG